MRHRSARYAINEDEQVVATDRLQISCRANGGSAVLQFLQLAEIVAFLDRDGCSGEQLGLEALGLHAEIGSQCRPDSGGIETGQNFTGQNQGVLDGLHCFRSRSFSVVVDGQCAQAARLRVKYRWRYRQMHAPAKS